MSLIEQRRWQRVTIAAGLLLAAGAPMARAQEPTGDLETRARALAAERLAPLLDLLGRSAGPAQPEQPEGTRFLIHFSGDVHGLAPGAPVTVRGQRVGTVREIAVTFDSTTSVLDVPVVIDIVPGSVVVDGRRPDTADAVREMVGQLVARGLRAQLASPNLLSPSREVALDIAADAAPATLGSGSPPEIPTLPTRQEALQATLDKALAEFGRLPLDRLAAEAEAILVAVRDLATAPELRQSLVDLAAAAGDLRVAANEVAARADPLIASLSRAADTAGPAAVEVLGAARDLLAGPEPRQILANLTALSAELRDMPGDLQARADPLLAGATAAAGQAGQAAGEARRTIAALDATFGSRSTFQADLQTLLREVTGATRSLRQVLDLLQRQPDVLVRGKTGGPPP